MNNEEELAKKDEDIKELRNRVAELEDKDWYEICIRQLEELAIYERTLELACENIRDMYCSDYCICIRNESCKEKCRYKQYYDKEKFLDQAKKELEKGE